MTTLTEPSTVTTRSSRRMWAILGLVLLADALDVIDATVTNIEDLGRGPFHLNAAALPRAHQPPDDDHPVSGIDELMRLGVDLVPGLGYLGQPLPDGLDASIARRVEYEASGVHQDIGIEKAK